jgi:hypothetical protein
MHRRINPKIKIWLVSTRVELQNKTNHDVIHSIFVELFFFLTYSGKLSKCRVYSKILSIVFLASGSHIAYTTMQLVLHHRLHSLTPSIMFQTVLEPQWCRTGVTDKLEPDPCIGVLMTAHQTGLSASKRSRI